MVYISQEPSLGVNRLSRLVDAKKIDPVNVGFEFGKIRPDEMLMLADSVKKQGRIQRITLNGPFDDTCALAWADAIKVSDSLTRFNFRARGLSAVGLNAIADAVCSTKNMLYCAPGDIDPRFHVISEEQGVFLEKVNSHCIVNREIARKLASLLDNQKDLLITGHNVEDLEILLARGNAIKDIFNDLIPLDTGMNQYACQVAVDRIFERVERRYSQLSWTKESLFESRN